jgi:hypothetical protein
MAVVLPLAALYTAYREGHGAEMEKGCMQWGGNGWELPHCMQWRELLDMKGGKGWDIYHTAWMPNCVEAAMRVEVCVLICQCGAPDMNHLGSLLNKYV